MEEVKSEGSEGTNPAPLSDFELAYDYRPTSTLSQEEAKREVMKTENDPTHPFWVDHRFHSEAVQRQLDLHKIVNPASRIQPGQISKGLSLREAGVTEEELSKIPEKLQKVVDEENWSRAVKPLQAEWGEKYEEKMNRVKELVGFGGEAIKGFLDDTEGDTPALGNDPAFVKALDAVAELIQRQQKKLEESRRYKKNK